MKSLLFLAVLTVSLANTLLATEFEKLGALYDATEVNLDLGWGKLKKPSAWTGKCVTSREPDKFYGAYFMTYDPTEGVFSGDPYASLMFMTNDTQELNNTEQVDDAGIKDLFDARKKFAAQVSYYKNDLAWIRGRGFELTTIRPEFDENSIARIHVLITCIGDEETCKKRSIGHGRWRHCMLDKKRI